MGALTLTHCTYPPRPGEIRYGTYRVPSPCACDVEYARYQSDDLAGLTEIEVEAELQAMVPVLAQPSAALPPFARNWLIHRRLRLLQVHRAPEADAERPKPQATLPDFSGGVSHTHKVRVV
jgi:hypothetical protein